MNLGFLIGTNFEPLFSFFFTLYSGFLILPFLMATSYIYFSKGRGVHSSLFIFMFFLPESPWSHKEFNMTEQLN